MPDKNLILSNCLSASGYNGESVTNISASRLVDLLISRAETGHGNLKRECKDLLLEMERYAWTISAGIHAGGLGGGGRAADPRRHITLRVRATSYHLRFGGGDGTTLIEIT